MKKITISFTREDSRAAIKRMDQLFKQGWKTLHETKWYECCGHFSTTLYLD